MSVHLVWEQAEEIQCMIAKSTYFGYPLTQKLLLRVAVTPNTIFLLQADLRGKQQGLEYGEKKNSYES